MLKDFPLAEVELLPVPETIEGAGTIDVLAQRVIPKLLNNVKLMGARIDRLECAADALLTEAQAQRQAYEYLYKWSQEVTDKINTLASSKPATRKRVSRKKEVSMSEIADYDSDVDVWSAKHIDGISITGALLARVDALGTDAGQEYPDAVLAFVDKLTDAQREAISEKFPG